MCGFAIFRYGIINFIGRKFSRWCRLSPGCVPALPLCRRLPGRRRRAWRLVSGSACASLTCPPRQVLPFPTYLKDCRTDVSSLKGLASCRVFRGEFSPTVLQRLYAFAVFANRQSDFYQASENFASLHFVGT